MIKENDIEHEKVTLNSYDEEGQLIKTAITDEKSQTTMTTTNRYNGDGERIEKDVNGEKTYYYVVNDAVLYTYKITSDEKGNEIRTITSQNVVAPDGSIISSKRSEGYYIYNLDLKGSTVSIVAPDGNYKLVYAYDIYGEPVKRGDKDFYNEITYTGAVYDESTGLYYMNARYYDPETGRFITEDSERGEFDDPLTQHLYAYCQNNPTNKVDPSGNISFRAICTIGGAVIGGAVGAYRSYKKTGKVRLKSVVVGAAIGAAVGFFGAKYGRKVYQAVKNSKKVGNIAHKVNSKTKPLRSKAKSVYNKVTCKITNRSCFIAGTLVETAYGYKPIENISVGDLVYSENPETGEKELKEVIETYENESDELVHILVRGEEIVTTPTHPFYTPDKGWRDAVKLKAGDKLVLRNGEVVVINEVSHEILEKPVKVYNFNVKDFHTYYVSDNSVLVHNDCGGKITKKVVKKGRIGKQERLKQLANDPKVSKTLRGELKNIKTQKGAYKVPKGYQLAHNKGYEAYKGYGYKHTRLQLIQNHKNEHKFYKPWLKRASKIFRRR
ncbi:polymorphic toxin-type HINT domain-containing protein [Anaerofustis butyriciformans]|uniref:polymorphic toxin-type HINT domain-containing protein n=1 Tax=Anaerofustis butyriciformans TaxID=3108533 RepID=UPI003F8CDBCE